jgi:hypothetical protein
MKKSILVLLLVAALLLPLAAMAEDAAYSDAPYHTTDLPQTEETYYAELDLAELWNWKQIRNYPTLYTKESWQNYLSACANLQRFDHDNLTDQNKAELDKIKAAREALVQIKPFEGLDGEVIYIWGEDMPVTTPAETLVMKRSDHDNQDYAPFIIPYLVEDQSQAKGIWLVTSGGGNSFRSNPAEAYNICPKLNELGYNAFLLQRRVSPYNNDDIVMDMQRAIRVIKANGEKWGLGGMDVIVNSGYSGSGGNLRVMLEKFYGDITPDQFDTDYVCDEIDKVNSDFDVAVFIYSGNVINTENPNIPHIFIGVGEDDSFEGSIKLFQQLKGKDPRFAKVEPELHIYGQNGHGFGAGIKGTSSELWLESADLYIGKVMGKNEIIVTGDPPEEFVLKQVVVQNDASTQHMDMVVTVYTTADHGKYYATYVTRGNLQIIYGVLIGDHPVEPEFDLSGGYAAKYNAHNIIWGLCDQTAWEPR